LICQTSKCLFLSKVDLLWGEYLIMGNRGSFWNLWSISLEQLSLCLNKCVWLRDRELSLICKNKTKWWQRMIQICQIWFKTNLCSHLNWCCTSFSCFLLCWHKSPKRGRLKGKCANGPFLSILVIECQHKWTYVNLCKVMVKLQIKSKDMFLDLVHCF
jgi:hypothetical protein